MSSTGAPRPGSIGFGAYRVAAGVPEHEAALRLALDLGCSLIDTAATYTGGRSELLVGRVLRDWPGQRPYIITKAGYENGGHSLEPDFLRARLAQSLARLDLPRVDAFLLHNPESWHDDHTAADPEGFYDAIERAFAFLEEQAECGTIGCYGISSNILPLGADDPAAPSLHRLIEIARRTSASHHFGVVEFPFNILEQEALRPRHEGASLIALGHSEGLRLVANRPLNAITAKGAVRLATYEEDFERRDRDADERVVGATLALIEHRLGDAGLADEAALRLVEYLRGRWDTLSAPELVDDLFARRLRPLLARAYENPPSAAEGELYTRFQQALRASARSNQHYAGQEFREQLVSTGQLEPSDRRPLALIACQYPLEVGIDHVLVGMRRPRYVELLSPLFARPAQPRVELAPRHIVRT